MSAPSARDRWLPLVRELEVSGLPVRKFARLHDVNSGTLSWWRSMLRREGLVACSTPAFVRFDVQDPVPRQAAGHLLVSLPRLSATVQVDAHTDLHLLRAVVEALC